MQLLTPREMYGVEKIADAQQGVAWRCFLVPSRHGTPKFYRKLAIRELFKVLYLDNIVEIIFLFEQYIEF